MKFLATLSALSLALGPVVVQAGGEVGPVITQQEEPVAAAPVIPGGVGGAPVEAAGAIPAGAVLAGLGGLAAVGLIVLLLDDDDGGSTVNTNTAPAN